MASLNKLFRMRSPKFELEGLFRPSATAEKGFGRSVAEKARPSEYTMSSKGGAVHVSPKHMQQLRMMGCSEAYISDLLHTINVLSSFSNRPVDPPVYEYVKRRYHLGMGTMASIAAISNLRLSDIGIDLRGIARFYSRNRDDVKDVEELEKFVNWVQARGEPVDGVPSAWRHYVSLNKKNRTTPSNARKIRRTSAKKRPNLKRIPGKRRR